MRQPDATDVAEIDQPAVGADEVWSEAMGRSPGPVQIGSIGLAVGHCRTHGELMAGSAKPPTWQTVDQSIDRNERVPVVGLFHGVGSRIIKAKPPSSRPVTKKPKPAKKVSNSSGVICLPDPAGRCVLP